MKLKCNLAVCVCLCALLKVARGVFCDQRSIQSGQGEVSCAGVYLQPVQPVRLCGIGKFCVKI